VWWWFVRFVSLFWGQARNKASALSALQEKPKRVEEQKKVVAPKEDVRKAGDVQKSQALKSQSMKSQVSSSTSQRMAGGSMKSQSMLSASEGSAARPRVSPRLTQKMTGAAISYGDLALGAEIGKGAYGKVLEGTYGGRKVNNLIRIVNNNNNNIIMIRLLARSCRC
jgi:hypothetical protein